MRVGTCNLGFKIFAYLILIAFDDFYNLLVELVNKKVQVTVACEDYFSF
jgi:hypothetical protein